MMQESDFINLLPAMIWWLIAISFLVLWRIKLTSWHCGVGFALTGTGFALDACPMLAGQSLFLSGLCYVGAVCLYSGCMLYHFEIKTRSPLRLILPLSYVALHSYFVFGIQSLRADLFLTDLVFACLFFHALVLVRSRVVGAADRFFLIAGGLVSTDCIVRSVVFTFILSSPDQVADFANSNYSVAVQSTTVTIGLLFPISFLAAMAARAIDGHRHAADIDPLTGIINRRGFFRLVNASRSRGPSVGALMVADIDHFKQVNDKLGHKAGDAVIKALATDLRDLVGPAGIVARFGGEEFVAYFPGRTVGEALSSANAVNHDFGIRDWSELGARSHITVSIGVTSVSASEGDVDAAIDRADKALYAAKEDGRDRVVVNVEPDGRESQTMDGKLRELLNPAA